MKTPEHLLPKRKLLSFLQGITYSARSPYLGCDFELFHFFSDKGNIDFNIIVFSIAVTAPDFFYNALFFYNLARVFEQKFYYLKFFERKFYCFSTDFLKFTVAFVKDKISEGNSIFADFTLAPCKSPETCKQFF